jgi:hypothetical protein
MYPFVWSVVVFGINIQRTNEKRYVGEKVGQTQLPYR